MKEYELLRYRFVENEAFYFIVEIKRVSILC